MNHQSALLSYYRLHAPVYDATRWSFLFGRNQLIRQIMKVASPRNILEVGCGTGTNLRRLARLCPEATLTGIDASSDMLSLCRKKLRAWQERVTLQQGFYPENVVIPTKPDLILFSYSLSMFNPGWEEALQNTSADLKPGGIIAVADLHLTPSAAFRKWMGINHVRMEGHLYPALKHRFTTVWEEILPAYGGIWRYFLFVGTSPQNF
jgi:S-adenosylmethionine-diacylgycerolhomoserine-N-methlytransferase